MENRTVLCEGKFLRLVKQGHWEFVERTKTTGIVVIVAVTDSGNLLLTEQFRIPVGGKVIELPAGLAGDAAEFETEELATAARRELLEETGYDATQFEPLSVGPPTAGLSSEVVTLFRARNLRRVANGGGVEGENIVVHEVPLAAVKEWLNNQAEGGLLIDPKVYAGLYFLGKV